MATRSDVCGVWRLQRYDLKNLATGERTEVFGAQPSGVLILLAQGRMAAVVTPSDQPAPLTDADQVTAFKKLIAYSGVYRIEPPDRFVTTVDVAWFAPWVGTEQGRTFSLDGDALEIVSDPTTTPLTGDAQVVGVLTWVRES